MKIFKENLLTYKPRMLRRKNEDGGIRVKNGLKYFVKNIISLSLQANEIKIGKV